MEIYVAIALFVVIISVAFFIFRSRKQTNMYVTRKRQIQAFPPGYRGNGKQ